jgi:hypothetical protein
VGLATHISTLKRENRASWRPSSATLLLLGWLVIPLAAIWLKSNVSESIWYPRNLLPLRPAALLLCARALCLPLRVFSDTQWWSRTTVAGAALATFWVFAAGPLTGEYYNSVRYEQFREATKFVIDNYDQTPRTPIIAYTTRSEYFDYYFEYYGSSLRVTHHVSKKKNVIRRLDTTLRKKRNAWLLVGHKSTSSFEKEFRQRFAKVRERRLVGTQATLYRLAALSPGRPRPSPATRSVPRRATQKRGAVKRTKRTSSGSPGDPRRRRILKSKRRAD